jgi:hypothetical protein
MNKHVIMALIFLSGCSTIHFDQVNTPDANMAYVEKWHHNVGLALYEASDPVNLEKVCSSKGWQSVKTETTFINYIAEMAVNTVGPIWYPQTVSIACK